MSTEPETPNPVRHDKRVHVALPVRVTCWDKENKPCLELACTYDISAHGARVSGLRYVKQAGEIIAIERGRNKSFCRVVWIGDENSERTGQIGVQCVETERTMWEPELRDLDEVFDLLQGENSGYRPSAEERKTGNRRRQQRFEIDGVAGLVKTEPSVKRVEAVLQDLSEFGCRVAAKSLLTPGTECKVMLNVADYDLALRGRVRHVEPDFRVGIEFQEIRKGDRQMLQYLLRTLAEREQGQDITAESTEHLCRPLLM